MNQSLGSHNWNKAPIPKQLFATAPSQITPAAHAAPHNYPGYNPTMKRLNTFWYSKTS